jgi:hypothetical protein
MQSAGDARDNSLHMNSFAAFPEEATLRAFIVRNQRHARCGAAPRRR